VFNSEMPRKKKTHDGEIGMYLFRPAPDEVK